MKPSGHGLYISSITVLFATVSFWELLYGLSLRSDHGSYIYNVTQSIFDKVAHNRFSGYTCAVIDELPGLPIVLYTCICTCMQCITIMTY